jgi:poly(3-hydroxybutyrate) depolymerase
MGYGRFIVAPRLCLAVMLVTAAAPPAQPQTHPTGPQVVSFFSDVDDTDQPYGLYLPKRFDARRRYPLVVMLHGAGSNHRLALRRVFGKSNLPGETDVEATRYFPAWRDVDFIVVTPFARGTMGYQGIAEKDVYDVLADVRRRFPIDEDRIYLTGLSMGGGGTLWLGLTRPDLWAAIAPVCPAPPEGTVERSPNALNLPVHVFQGGADPVVKPEGTRELVRQLEQLGTAVQYTEYPGVGHNSWENAYKDEAIFDWFRRFRRTRHPERVRFVTDRYRYTRAYWVRLDELTPGTQASIDARFVGPNRLEVTTSGLSAFTLNLPGHPRFAAGRPIGLTVDGQALVGPASESVSLSQRDGRWMLGRVDAAPESKRDGAEGPITEAVASRHVYVYGTAGDPSPEELERRRAEAVHAAEWSVDRGAFLGRVMVFPRTLADKDVRPSDLESANLVLFGTRETNGLIQRFADRLPLHLAPSASGYGLVYVFPIGGREVLVSSGLPWWSVSKATPAQRASRPAFRLPGGAAGLLPRSSDYVLFKGSLDEVVAEGRFDGRWRLSAKDAAALSATGAVLVEPPRSSE